MTIYIAIFLSVFMVSSIVELYKNHQRLYGNDVSKTVAMAIALLFSMAISTVLYFSFSMINNGATKWSIIYYGLVIYFLQKELSMEILKPILRKLGDRI